MYREHVTARLSLVERDNIEQVLSGDDTRQPDDSRLVAHDQTTVARLAHAAPGRLGQVGGGQDEVRDGRVVGAGPGVRLDVGRGS